MGTLGLVLFIVLPISAIIAWRWVKGIDYMQKNHPNYKGEDFLNCEKDDDITKTAGRDGWDDNLFHTEGGL